MRGEATIRWTGGINMTRSNVKTSRTRDTGGAQQEAVVRQVMEALVDERCWCDKRRLDNPVGGRRRHDKRGCKNQSDERHERGSMRGGGVTSDGGTWTKAVDVTRDVGTTSRTRGAGGAVDNESSSSCSYPTINKKEIGQRHTHHLRRRCRRDCSPGGVNSAWPDGATRAGGRGCNESGRARRGDRSDNTGGGRTTWRERAMSIGRRDESSRGD